MGFLSAWDDNERIDVSDLAGDLPGTWWVDVKKCLTHAEAEDVMKHLMKGTMQLPDNLTSGGEKIKVQTKLSVEAVVDHQAYIVARSIVGWNLTDRNGALLPFEVDDTLENPWEPVEASLAKLPAPVYDRVAKVVVAANTESSSETATFPAGDEGRDSDGQDLPSDDRQVLV